MQHRKLNRFKGYDYSEDGYYFFTICVKDRLKWFGTIENGAITLNKNGNIVLQCWNELPSHYNNIKLDAFIIMPNRVHGIIIIENVNVGNGLKPFPTKNHGLSEMIRALKTFSSRKINERNDENKFHWQKSFYDHIISNEYSLLRIREYILNNPKQWEFDIENTVNSKGTVKEYYAKIFNYSTVDNIVGNGLKPFPTI